MVARRAPGCALTAISAPRALRARDGAALVLASVIGAGIFTVPALVAQLAGTAGAFLAVWLVGGVLALAGALSYAELASRIPEAGGEYVYLREAFGPLAAFLSGWTSFAAGFSGAIAASAVGFALYLERLVPAVGAAPWMVVGAGPLTVTWSAATTVAVGVIVLFTAISVTGMHASRNATNVLTVALVIAIAAVAIAGLGAPPRTVSGTGQATLSGFAAALVPVMFTFSGWNSAAYVTNEFAEPLRAVPRALIAGTVTVTLLYVGVNVAYLRALGFDGLVGAPAVADATAGALFRDAGAMLITFTVLVALASSVCAMSLTGPRIYRQMARDGVMPAAFGVTRARDGSPVGAIVAQGAWSIALVLTGTFEALITYTGVAIVVFGAAAVGAVVVLRRRGVGRASFRVPGYPFIPLAFVGASAWMIVATVQRAPLASLAGLGVIGAGMPMYYWRRRRRSANRAD